MFHHVIGIRTNRWTIQEEDMYRRLLDVFPEEEIFIVADETKGEVPVPDGLKKISWDFNFLERQGLMDYDHFKMGIGWLCGDYFYYAFQQHVLSDYYWLIEPDVGISFESWTDDFFSRFNQVKADALLANFHRLVPKDYWYRSATLLSEDTYGCSFPLNRLSYKAIHRCFMERQRMVQLFKEYQCRSNTDNPLGIHFPNDEALVATTLMREGFDVKDLGDFVPNAFDFFGYHHVFVQPLSGSLRPRDQVLHPVRLLPVMAEKLADKIISNVASGQYLDDVTLAPDDVSIFAQQIGHAVSDYVVDTLSQRSEFTLDFADLGSMVRRVVNQSPYDCKCWVYQDNVFVVDLEINNQQVVTEFCLDGKEVTCYTFSRTDTGWVSDLQAVFPQLPVDGHKMRQFQVSFERIEEISSLVEQALVTFFNLFN